MRHLIQLLLIMTFGFSYAKAEILTLEDFREHLDGSAWDSIDLGTQFRSVWSPSQFTVNGNEGGYFGPYGKEGNTSSTRLLARAIPTNQASTLWGTMDFEVQTNGSSASSVSQFTIGQGSLGKNVSLIGVASGRTHIAEPVSSTLWALKDSTKPKQLKVLNRDARHMTRVLWKLQINPTGSEKMSVWFAPENLTSEASLGDPDLSIEGFDWTHPIKMIRFSNNGQSRFKVDNLFIATELSEVAEVLSN